MKRNRVLFVIDNPRRELWGIRRVAKKLSQYGFVCHIISKLVARKYIYISKPDICILPRIKPDFDSLVGELGNEVQFFHIPSEHGLDFEIKLINNLYGLQSPHPKNLDKVEKIYLPGNFSKNVVIKNSIYTKKQIKVTGTLNADRWKIEKKNNYEYPIFPK